MDELQTKDIPGYEGLYTIDTDGNVFSKKRGKYLRKFNSAHGYPMVGLYKNGKQKRMLIHRLVAQAFIPNPENKSIVNHIDCDKGNYAIDNLEWCTTMENIQHAFGMDRHPKMTPAKKAAYDRSRELTTARYSNGLTSLTFHVSPDMIGDFYSFYYAECDKNALPNHLRTVPTIGEKPIVKAAVEEKYKAGFLPLQLWVTPKEKQAIKQALKDIRVNASQEKNHA